MSRKKVIYIAGPYRSDKGAWHIRENIRNAGYEAVSIWMNGGIALCPHLNTAFFDGAGGLDDSVWLDGDLELLSRCDAVYAMQGYKHSSGALAEIEFAIENNIPVLYSRSEIKCYLNER